ncbi:hypothetical protein BTJ49_03565 [Oleiagrimonas sp. MCCC 1A03011]|nr:hypothetical protein BTJ49_03565 [Oleiagrimonas sp. MCCC 1A03011]
MGTHYKRLSAKERGTIMALRHVSKSIRAVALCLRRSPSTISRELRRNGGLPCCGRSRSGRSRHRPGYDTVRAGKRAHRLRRKPRRPRKLHRKKTSSGSGSVTTCTSVVSPEQIADILGHSVRRERVLREFLGDTGQEESTPKAGTTTDRKSTC